MQDYRLQVRTRGSKREYRILNASRQVVAQGVLNCSEDNHEKDLKKIAKLIAEVWKTEDEAPIMSRGSYGHDTAWYIRQLRKLGYKDEISAEDFNEAWDMAARKEDLDSGCHGKDKLNSAVGTGLSDLGVTVVVNSAENAVALEVFEELADWFDDEFPDNFLGPYPGTVETFLRLEGSPQSKVYAVDFQFSDVNGDDGYDDEAEEEIIGSIDAFNHHLQARNDLIDLEDTDELPAVDVVDFTYD